MENDKKLDEAARVHAGIPLDRVIDAEERYYQKERCQIYDAFLAGAKFETPKSDPLTEAIMLLKEMHSNALYKIGPGDDRPTHLPIDLFDRVEEYLKNNPGGISG